MKKILFNITFTISLLLITGCTGASDSTSSETETTTETTTESEIEITVETTTDSDFEAIDWTDETHSKNVDPNFTEVFDDSEVKRIDIVVTSDEWQSMLDNMTELYGEFGSTSTAIAQPGAGVVTPVEGETPIDGVFPPLDDTSTLPEEGALPPGAPVEAGTISTLAEDTTDTETDTELDEDPIFVGADIYYNSIQWYEVGIRFKGNSSLESAWQSGNLKLSFKLDFDEYEDDYPQIKNQRFYGFKKLSLKNNYDDSSFLREKVAADVFRDAGLAVSNTAFYEVYVDHGDGPEYFGLYTLVEEVDDTLIDTQFSSDDGNLYKPEEGSANFVENTFSSDDFEKKTNEDDEDWSDIESLFTALHDTSRTTDAATWRANLEEVFDVDTFLKYLAVNGVIQNWDTYGRMIHNYYLYNNPDTGKLTWIPWDNNEALQDGKLGGSLALDFSDLEGDVWPLIEKIYADETYKATYDTYVQEVIDDSFNTVSLEAKYDTYSELIESSATSEREGYTFLNDSSDFSTAITELKTHVNSRKTAAETYLNQ